MIWKRVRDTVRGLIWFYFKVYLGNLSLRTFVWLSLSCGAQEVRHNNLRVSAGLVKPSELSLHQREFQTVS